MQSIKKKFTPSAKLDPVSHTLKKRGRWFSRDWQLYLLLLPAVIYVIIFCYGPMYGVQIAFRDYSARKGIWGSDWVGFKHFIRFFKYPNFWLLLKNTLRLGIYCLLTFPLPVIFAIMVNEIRNQKFKKTVQMISYIPYFLSVVVVCSMVCLFFDGQTGVVNTIIEALGGERIDFLTVPEYFDELYVWSGVWQTLGFSAIIYVAALSNVPEELVEAARIDGASRWQIIWHVNIPCILPTIIIQLIFSCGGILGASHEKILLLQNPLNLSTSQVISTYVYELGIKGGQFSYSAAIGLFNNIVNVLVLFIVNKIAKKTTDISVW